MIPIISIFSRKNKPESKPNKTSRNIYGLLFILFLIAVFISPYFFIQSSFIQSNFQNSGQIGDTIGGIVGPLIAIVAAILTFFAFWVQYRANQQQVKTIKSQNADIKLQRFENNFFEMLKIHRENINAIEMKGYKQNSNKKINTSGIRYTRSRKFFSKSFLEFIACHKIIETINEKSPKKIEEDLAELAFKFYYHGFDGDVVAVLKDDEPTFEKIKEQLKLESKSHYGSSVIDELNEIKYKPFQGHEWQLEHYYKHFINTLYYIKKKHEESVFDEDNLKQYLNLLHAQLSTDELFMFYNYLLAFGEENVKKDLKDLFSKSNFQDKLVLKKTEIKYKNIHGNLSVFF